MVDLPEYRREERGAQPPTLHPAYTSTVKRAPQQPPVRLPHTLSEVTGPRWDRSILRTSDHDLTRQHGGEPLGERIIVTGRVLDEDGRPVGGTLIEIWQANAAGRYAHPADRHDAPLDPHFTGTGRVVTDEDGRYRVVTIKPGAYPWRNHHNAWRPAHVHFSLFGPAFATRLVTQMYFPGDPLIAMDPVLGGIPDAEARARLVASFDIEATAPDWALGYRFDIVLRGRAATPMEG
jgi:protocatechuate 3,4-dioxygenase, beta subunit